jgi:hypothetical protein
VDDEGALRNPSSGHEFESLEFSALWDDSGKHANDDAYAYQVSYRDVIALTAPMPGRQIASSVSSGPAHPGPHETPHSEKRCQLNRSMQHHLISWSNNTFSKEPICKAVINQNLNRAVFRLHQRP